MMRDEDLARRLVVRRGAGGNCTYDEGAKRELVEACLHGGHSVAQVARAYGLNTNQLHNWIALHRKERVGASLARSAAISVDTPSAFIPVVTAPSSAIGHGLQLHIILANGIRADLGPLRRDDVAALLADLSRLPCSASTRGDSERRSTIWMKTRSIAA